MKKGWEIKKLEDVAIFQRGLTYSKKDEVEISSNIILRANNIDFVCNKLDLTELRYINNSIKIPKEKKVRKGSLIICTASGSKSHLGKVALIDDDYDYAFGGFMGQITPSKEIDSNYFFYVLTSDAYKKFVSELSDGVNINNLKFDDLKKFSFPVPPFYEQKSIAVLIGKAFAAINIAKANAEKNLQNAKTLFDCYLQNVFANPGEDWVEKKLAEITEVKDGTHDSPAYIKDGIPFVTQKNIREAGLTLEDTKYITKEDHDKFYKRSNVTYGDIIISMIGANRGMSCIVNDKKIFSIKNVGLIKKTETINQNYLLYFLKSPIAKEYVSESSNGGAQEFVGLTALRNFPVLVAPRKEQDTIVANLDALSIETKKLETIYQQKLNNLEELKKSILQKAFAGELTYATEKITT